jgi:TolB-like protein
MPSLLPGYEYDVFISYRHNDNRSGWVTEFVKHLNEELAATVKQPLSLYFDSNPDDGLLQTHNVNKSLEGKIKSLIFLPILSQTYCDESGFAWSREFLPFVSIVNSDPLGKHIRLINGNFADRILPIRIHDLEEADKKSIERLTGSPLRSIDFVYKSSGVNRPLKVADEKTENQYHTSYADQVNKVANAIKEIVHALVHKPSASTITPPSSIGALTQKKGWLTRKKALYSVGIVLLTAVGTAAYYMSGTGSEMSKTEASIAVLPFSNLSNDPEQEYFSDGITDQIITNLSHIQNIKVISRTSVMKFKKTSASIPDISSELNVNYVLEGSVQRSGDKIRINAQLIRAKDDFHEWAEIFNRDASDIFKVQDEISKAIAEALGKKLNPADEKKVRLPNPVAYDFYLKAKHIAFSQYYYNPTQKISDTFESARKMYEKAISLDPEFALAYAGLADLYDELRNHDKKNFPDSLNKLRLSLSEKAYALDPNSGFVNNVRAWMFINVVEGPVFAEPALQLPPALDSGYYFLKRAVELEPDDAYFNWCFAGFLADVGLHEQSLPYHFKAVEINPLDPKMHFSLGGSLLSLGRVDEAGRTMETADALAGASIVFGKGNMIRWMIITKQPDRLEKFLVVNPNLKNENLEAMIGILRNDLSLYNKLKDPSANLLYLVGKPYEALKKQEEFVDKGFNSYQPLKNSPNWKDNRDDPEYQRVLAKAKLNYDKVVARFH